MNALCSVYVTVYNRSEFITETLNSVFLQSYRPIELVICDDASTDSSTEVINNWTKTRHSEDFKVILIVNETNSGAPYSRNRALELCSGEFIQSLDSDDLLHPNKLAIQIKALEDNPTAQSAWNPLQRFYESFEFSVVTNLTFIDNQNFENPFKLEFLPSAAIHRASVLKNTGPWNEKLKRWQDLEFQLRIISKVESILVFSTPFYYFRQHNNGRIHDQYKSIEGIANGIKTLAYVEDIIDKEFKLNQEIKYELFNFYLSIYFLSLKSNNSEFERKLLLKLFRWSPKFSLSFKVISLTIISFTSPISFRRKILKKYL